VAWRPAVTGADILAIKLLKVRARDVAADVLRTFLLDEGENGAGVNRGLRYRLGIESADADALMAPFWTTVGGNGRRQRVSAAVRGNG